MKFLHLHLKTITDSLLLIDFFDFKFFARLFLVAFLSVFGILSSCLLLLHQRLLLLKPLNLNFLISGEFHQGSYKWKSVSKAQRSIVISSSKLLPHWIKLFSLKFCFLLSSEVNIPVLKKLLVSELGFVLCNTASISKSGKDWPHHLLVFIALMLLADRVNVFYH